MFELYPHQKAMLKELYDGIRNGHHRQILGAATGCGKTVMASQVAEHAVSRGKKVLFIVHLTTLVNQAVNTFERMGLKVGILQAENTNCGRDDDIIVASIQTIAARSAPDWVHVIIIDEVHVEYEAHRQLLDDWNQVPVVGLSATPLRKGLGQRYSRLVKGPSIAELTDMGYLSPVKAFAPSQAAVERALQGVSIGYTPNGKDYRENELSSAMNRKDLVGDIVKTWRERGENRPTLCFACTIAHSQAIAQDFVAEGVVAEHIGSDTGKADSLEAIERFRRGETKILSSVYKLATGFDVPDASCLILARPTKSEMLAIQTLGRGLRIAEGKTDCIILDHAGVLMEHGLPGEFELPDDLNDVEKGKSDSEKQEKKPSLCKGCGKVLEKGENPCSVCGEARPIKQSEVTYSDDQLMEWGAQVSTDLPSRKVIRDWYLGFVQHWVDRGKEHAKARGIAYHQTLERFPGVKVPWSWRDYQPTPPSLEQQRWIKYSRIKWAKSKAGQGHTIRKIKSAFGKA